MFTNIRQLIHEETKTYTYLLWSGNEAILIDPVAEDIVMYVKLLKELNLKLAFAIDTHVHADHITALGLLREQTQCKTIFGKESGNVCADILVSDNSHINFGSHSLQCIYTPGHTSDSYCYLLTSTTDEQATPALFTGDTLLIRGCGRTDFQNGNSENLYNSLQKLMQLPPETVILPGHDYNGRTSSSIAEEAKNNPRLQLSKTAFIGLMDNLNLPDPEYMDIAVPANLVCGNTTH